MSKTVSLVAAGILAAAAIWLVSRVEPTPDSVVGVTPQPIVAAPSDVVEIDGATAPSMPPPSERPEPTPFPPVDFDALDGDRDIAGFVLDRDGKAIPGATVSVRDEAIERVTDLTLGDPLATLPARSTVTGDDGSFALRLERGEETHVRASAPGFGTGFAPNAVAGKTVEITLAPEAGLELRTLDEDGGAIGSTRVRVWRRSQTDSYDHRKSVTDSEGRAVISGLSPGKIYVAVAHDRFGSPAWEFPVLEAGVTTELELVLPRGRTLRGRVVDAITGGPVARARVGAGWTQSRSKRTDAEGAYEFPGWTGEGVETLVVTARGYGRKSVRVGAEDRIDFELVPAYAVAGRVVDESGAAIEDARVSAVASQFVDSEQHTDSAKTRTSSEGRFELVSLNRLWPYTIVFQHRGRGRYLIDIDASLAEDGLIDLGDVTIPVGRSIEGEVLRETGEGIADAVVELRGHNHDRGALREGKALAVEGFYAGVETRTADDIGRFRFPDLSPGEYTITVRLEGRSPLVETVELAEADIRDLRLQFGESRTTVVRVLVAGSRRGVEKVRMSLHLPQTRTQLRARTNEDGEATFAHEEATHGARLHVRAPAGYVSRNPTRSLAGEREIEILLQESARISGTLVSKAGEAIGHRPIDVISPSGDQRSVWADADGRFAIDALAGEIVDLRLANVFERADGTRAFATIHGELRGISAPASDLKLVGSERPLDGTISFRVIDPDGAPVAGIVVPLFAVWNLVEQDMPTTDGDGRVRFDELPREELEVGGVQQAIEGDQEGYVLYSEPRRVTPTTDEREIVIELARCFAVSGTVRGADGSPPGRTELVAVRDDGKEFARTTSSAEGRFLFRLPVDRRYTILATHQEMWARLEVAEPTRAELVLETKR